MVTLQLMLLAITLQLTMLLANLSTVLLAQLAQLQVVTCIQVAS